MPFEFKKARTPRQQQADNVKRRAHAPALAPSPPIPPGPKLPELATMSPYRIAPPPQPSLGFRLKKLT
jgi:hypothetical protein